MAKQYDRLKLRPQSELIIALDDLDLSFTREETDTVLDFWGEGKHIADIAEKLHRDQDEVAILIMHLARQERIAKRKMGVLGT